MPDDSPVLITRPSLIRNASKHVLSLQSKHKNCNARPSALLSQSPLARNISDGGTSFSTTIKIISTTKISHHGRFTKKTMGKNLQPLCQYHRPGGDTTKPLNTSEWQGGRHGYAPTTLENWPQGERGWYYWWTDGYLLLHDIINP